ncbi:hypothetical protein BH09BAC1_BH09BAC1_13260 [soil metagenome]
MKTVLVCCLALWLIGCAGEKPAPPQPALVGTWMFHSLTINEASNPHPDEHKSLKFNELMMQDNGIVFEFAAGDSVTLSSKEKVSPGTYKLSADGKTAHVKVIDNSPDVFDLANITDSTFTVTLPQDLPFHILHFKKKKP